MEAIEESVLDLSVMESIDLMPSFDQRIYNAALGYIKCGFALIPLRVGEKLLPPKKTGLNYGTASKKRGVIDKWFHPETGKYTGYNIGIVTGMEGGIFVIDIDCHGEIDGREVLKELEETHGELPIGPAQTTANGGEHRLFRWQNHAVSSTNKIGESIDTRGGDEDSHKAHIVVWPSIVGGKKYTWKTTGPLPFIPKWVMEAMGVVWTQPNPRPERIGVGRGNENVAIDDFESIIPLEQVGRMLEVMNPDDFSYDEWLRVGMAIKSQYPEMEGLSVWDEWSRKGDRYKINECALRWEGFAEFGAVRMGTLFHFAKERDWVPKKDDVKIGRIHADIERVNSEYGLTVVGGKVRIIRDRIIHYEADSHMSSYDLLDKFAFETLMENVKVTVDEETGKKAPLSKIWLASEARRTYPNGIGLFPEGAPAGYYNTWGGFSVVPKEGDCSKFLNHIEVVICNNDELHYNWVLDWLADLIQNPSDPKGTALVLKGDEGTGKGTLANTMGSLFAGHYLHLIDDAHLTSNFNAFLMDAVIVFADEITWGGNRKTSGKLKGLVTERFLVCERKGVDAQSFRNMIHLIVASNSDWVIPAGTNSRRWFITEVSSDYRGDMKYFDELQGEIKNGGKEAILCFLLNRKITNDLRVAPVTKALQEQRNRSSSNTIVNWMTEIAMRGIILTPCIKDIEADWPSIVEKTGLLQEYKEWCSQNNARPEHIVVFFKELRKFKMTGTKASMHNRRIPAMKIPELSSIIHILLTEHHIDIEGDEDE